MTLRRSQPCNHDYFRGEKFVRTVIGKRCWLCGRIAKMSYIERDCRHSIAAAIYEQRDRIKWERNPDMLSEWLLLGYGVTDPHWMTRRLP